MIDLSWSQHITYLEDTLAQSLHMMRHYLISFTLNSDYFCLVYSHLQNAIGAWRSVPKTALNHLNVLHKKLIKASFILHPKEQTHILHPRDRMSFHFATKQTC